MDCSVAVYKSHTFQQDKKKEERKKEKLSVPSGGKTYIKMSKVIWPHPDHFRASYTHS
jgi:hypothetical protein